MRLFVAICLDPEIKASLVNIQNDMKARGIIANYSFADNIHITLAFIGETERITEARKCVASVDSKPFDISFGGMGYFGSLCWIGLENNDQLNSLALQVRNKLISKGFQIDNKQFKTHITLAREVSKKAKIDFPMCSMTVKSIKLMKSERISGRLTYTCIYSRNFEK